MKSFTKVFKEYYFALTIKGTTPKIVYSKNRGYECVWFFSNNTINRLGWEVIHGYN